MKGIIYKFTNKINNKIYIGQTINPKQRYKQHKRAKEDTYFHRAIKKYGFENFKYEVVVECDKSKLDIYERYFIMFYNSTENGNYNIAPGGKVLRGKYNPMYGIRRFGKDNPNYGNHKLAGKNNPNYGKHLSEETKKKMSENHYDCSGKNHPHYGKHPSEETRRKMSKAMKGKYVGKNHPMYGVHRFGEDSPHYHKGVILIYNDKEYSILELSDLIGINFSTPYFHIKKGLKEFTIKGHYIKIKED